MTPRDQETAHAIIEELRGRGGFDAWWSGIAPDVQDEIINALTLVIARG